MKKEPLRNIYLLIFFIVLLVIGQIIRNRKSANEKLFNLTKNELEKMSPPNGLSAVNTPKTLSGVVAKNIEAQKQMNQNAPLPPGANILTRERIYTQDEINNMTIDHFKEMLAEIERRLPKKNDLKELPPGALHFTPALIIEAGRNLGAVKEVLKIHQNYESLATPFYHQCAQNNESPTTVRALCLTNLILIKKKNNQKINYSDYPKEIIDLTKIVTDI